MQKARYDVGRLPLRRARPAGQLTGRTAKVRPSGLVLKTHEEPRDPYNLFFGGSSKFEVEVRMGGMSERDA